MFQRFYHWLRKDDAATAVEFAMLAMPLFTLIFGILELGMFYASGSVLEGGSLQAARLIRTGQVQESGTPEDLFQQQLCLNVSALLDCGKLQYEVIHMANDTFSSAASYKPTINSNGDLVPQPFNPGTSDSVVIVRAYYKWTFYTPFIGSLLTGSASKNWLAHMSTVVVKSEPYCATACP